MLLPVERSPDEIYFPCTTPSARALIEAVQKKVTISDLKANKLVSSVIYDRSASFYDPTTARRPHDGVFAIGTSIIPVGVLLGVTPG